MSVSGREWMDTPTEFNQTDLRPLLVCTDSAVMSAAAHVVGELNHPDAGFD